jgi:hypothetical protein
MSEVGFLEGSMRLVILTGGFLVLGFLLERLFVALKWPPYFRCGVAVWGPIRPEVRPPSEPGRNEWLHWQPLDSGEVIFWADARTRRSPSGLHGVWKLVPTEHGEEARAYWAPPWTPMFAAIWLVGLGATRGDAVMTATIAFGLIGTLGAVYGHMARRAIASWGEQDD